LDKPACTQTHTLSDVGRTTFFNRRIKTCAAPQRHRARVSGCWLSSQRNLQQNA